MLEKKNWAAYEVERRAVSALKPYARNPRTHSDEQVAQIAASIREWGWTSPILIDEKGGVIAGHGRLMAAKSLGVAEVPVIVAKGWTEAQKQAYVIADNQLAVNAGWDEGLLRVEIGALDDLGFDRSLLGFGEDYLADLFAEPAEPEPPKASLAERFGLPPFTVLNAREGWWQDRKNAWIALGIQSELGRGENLLQFSDTINEPDPAKRAKRKANGKTAARTFGQDLMRGEHVVGNGKAAKETASLKGGLVRNITADAYRARDKEKLQ